MSYFVSLKQKIRTYRLSESETPKDEYLVGY